MVVGNINKINLSISSFERMITEGCLYVDKTKVIEHFLETPSTVQLIARQRRLGKSLNMDTIKCFLTDSADLRHLFKGLYVESSPVWEKSHTAPVFSFDFKHLPPESYKRKIYYTICDYMDRYCTESKLPRTIKDYLNNEDYNDTFGLLHLTEAVFKTTGKRSYILIDEYDNMLMDYYNSAEYNEISAFLTALFSAGLKGNPYLEKALLTGVMRVSHESMFSGLNNIMTYDIFNDKTYTECYGLTEDEMAALNQMDAFDINETRRWYNGIRINTGKNEDGYAIYNTYSVMSFLTHKEYECFWGKSGTLEMIIGLLNDERKLTLVKLLNGEQIEVEADNRISLKQLDNQVGDEAFYSLLIQAGYLTLNERQSSGLAKVSIPNRELMIVWKNFILSRFYANAPQVRSLFDNADNLTLLSKDLEYFLSDRLSYHDLAVYKGENIERAQERVYHIYILGLLSAYENMRFRYPLSNRESGDGRYDVLVESTEAYYIFELKTCGKDADLNEQAEKALTQIETKRYGADLKPRGKKLIKIGIAVCGKLCKVKCAAEER